MDFWSLACTAALKRKSRGEGLGSSALNWLLRLRGLDGVTSGSGSTSASSLSVSMGGTKLGSGADLEKKLGMGKADGAGDAWNVGPA